MSDAAGLPLDARTAIADARAMTDQIAGTSGVTPSSPWWEEHPVRAVVAFGLAGLALATVWAAVVAANRDADGVYTLGPFGDAFGPVTAILNAVALGAAVLAVVLQRRELAMQRAEMRAQRDEMHAQRVAAEEQITVQRRHVDAIEAQLKEMHAQRVAAEEQNTVQRRHVDAIEAQLAIDLAHVDALRSQTEVQRSQALVSTLQLKAQIIQARHGPEHGSIVSMLENPYGEIWRSASELAAILGRDLEDVIEGDAPQASASEGR